LAIASARSSYHHWYGLTEVTCGVCHSLGDPLASWCLVNPARQHAVNTAPRNGLMLVRIPPEARGGIGQVQLWIDGVALADIDLAICGPCKRGVVEHVRTDEPHRRRGYGRVLVAAALTLAPPAVYRWSTTKVADNPVARAFWAGIRWPGDLEPVYCTDMERAAGRLPDW
jgi:GNAT superfamily N-acetyltransferase